MAFKTLLILLSLISYPSVSGAEQIHWQKYSLAQGQFQIAQDTDELFLKSNSYPSPATQASSTEYIDLKPLNPSAAFLYVLLPGLPLIPPLTPIGLITATFFTIPAHFYVHDSFLKTSLLTISKAGFATMTAIGFAIGIGNVIGGFGCALDESDDHDEDCSKYASSTGEGLAIVGIFGFVGVYLFELLNISTTAKLYNEKLKQQQAFYILPYAYKDQYRVNVGYRF